jgi:diphthamide synthase (EF-2-diphthine--ammonia ligase)
MTQLFKQLGLASDEASIQLFISQHEGVCRECGLVQAPIWSDTQREFLKEAVAEDADWAIPAEALTAALSRPI